GGERPHARDDSHAQRETREEDPKPAQPAAQLPAHQAGGEQQRAHVRPESEPRPSPSRRFAAGPSLSHFVGEGQVGAEVESPSPALGREREGPTAKLWEGEGLEDSYIRAIAPPRLRAGGRGRG